MCGTAEATKDHLNEHVYVTAASLAPRHHPGIDRHEQNPVCVESVWCVSYGSTMLRTWTWNQGQGSDWSVRGGIDTGPLVGDVQCSIWPMTPVEPSAPPVSVTRVGRVMALRKRNQTQQAEKNQNFKYHFHIPLSHTTAKINQKVVYTTQIPVNTQLWCLVSDSLAVSALSGLVLSRVRLDVDRSSVLYF